MKTPSSRSGHEVVIRSASDADLSQLTRCDFSFEVTAEFAEPFDGVRTTEVKQPYRKNYGFDTNELARYLCNPEAQLFVARTGCSPVGYVAVSRSWNKYAVVEDIAVNAPHRGIGVARLMMDAAVDWARNGQLAGVRLETQSVNVAACRFYERYGFRLGGYDRFLYRGLHPGSREVALFWYLHF